MNIINNVFCILLLLIGVTHTSAQINEVTSPNKNITLNTNLNDGKLFYSVTLNDKPVIHYSRLGIESKTGAFKGKMVITGSSESTLNETWEPVWGDFNKYRNHYNQLIIDLEESDAKKRKMQVVVRAYNDGIAFRYIFPEQKNLKEVNITKEHTSVSVISEDPIAWYAASSTTLHNHKSFNEITDKCRTPFTIQAAENCFISLHEAAVVNSTDARLTMGADKRTLTFSGAMKTSTRKG